MNQKKIRINKYLAHLGIASRRKVDQYIQEGRILINGEATHPGELIDPGKDEISFDGKKVEKQEEEHEYIILNKPRGVLSTVSDDEGRQTVIDLVKSKNRLYPVGRLDMDSEGLVLLTNDGDVAYKLTHPKFQIAKTYAVWISGHLDKEKIETIREGVKLDDGITAPARMNVESKLQDEAIFKITLYEGKKREIRRMCDTLHLEVIRLKRISIGPIEIHDLKEGQFRHLTNREIERLKEIN